jgi:hypothetical protein
MCPKIHSVCISRIAFVRVCRYVDRLSIPGLYCMYSKRLFVLCKRDWAHRCVVCWVRVLPACMARPVGHITSPLSITPHTDRPAWMLPGLALVPAPIQSTYYSYHLLTVVVTPTPLSVYPTHTPPTHPHSEPYSTNSICVHIQIQIT